jgi:hypothetical protein
MTVEGVYPAMSLALAHFAFGATVTTLLVAFLPGVRYPRTIVLAGGGWAMLPDLHWVSPVARQQLYRIHQSSPLTDLFWLHRSMDWVDPGDSKAVAAALVAVFLLVTAFAEWWSNRRSGAVEAGRGSQIDADASE